MQLSVVEGDLLDQDVEVIVNAWNRNVIPWWLLLPQGVSGAIKRRGGSAPFRELGRKGPIPLGGAVETGAGRLPHRAIIHVAGINLLWRSSERAIRDSVRSALRRAGERGYRSIAFPLIGAGSGGGRPDRVLAIMRDELAKIEFEGEVRIVQFKKAATSVQPVPCEKTGTFVQSVPCEKTGTFVQSVPCEKTGTIKTLMDDIKNPRLLYAKAALFVLGGIIASGLILVERPSIKVAALLAVAVWCFARAYYFAFYVIQHYIDPSYRFSSLWAFARYVAGKRRGGKDS
jgi:O-acetyl-ADP-ribose deacetylase (regulator of RNase III)